MTKLIIEIDLKENNDKYLGYSDISSLESSIQFALHEIDYWGQYFDDKDVRVKLDEVKDN